jgi:hypothetical protein
MTYKGYLIRGDREDGGVEGYRAHVQVVDERGNLRHLRTFNGGERWEATANAMGWIDHVVADVAKAIRQAALRPGYRELEDGTRTFEDGQRREALN